MSETTNQDELIPGEEYWISDTNKRPHKFNLGPGIYLGDDVYGDHYFKAGQILIQKKYYTRVPHETEKPKDDDIEVTSEMLADAATCIEKDCDDCIMRVVCEHGVMRCIELLAKALQKEKKKVSIWDDVPEHYVKADVTYKAGNDTSYEAMQRCFTRPYPKPIERQIAEKFARQQHPGCLNLSRKDLADIIESSINEYRNTRSPHD
jgi:hypothetical protein